MIGTDRTVRGHWSSSFFCSAVLLVAAGCDSPGVTLYPLLTSPSERLWEPGLVGTWAPADTEESSRVVVSRAGYYRYQIDFPSAADQEGQPSSVSAYLTSLQNAAFLDLTTRTDEPRPFLLPVHLAVRIALVGDTLWTGWISDEAWERWLRAYGAPVVKGPDGLLVTVGTDSVQLMLREAITDTTTNWHWAQWVRDRAPGALLAMP